MSEPPDYPGRSRAQRAAAKAAGDAYQGAFEAVMAVVVGAGFGYWADRRWETTPYGLVIGIVIGFAAMVLRLMRMGRELPGAGAVPADAEPDGRSDGQADGRTPVGPDRDSDADRGPAEAPALSEVWRDADERDEDERS